MPKTGELSNIGTRAMVLLLSNQVEKISIIKNLLPCESTLEDTWDVNQGWENWLGSETGPWLNSLRITERQLTLPGITRSHVERALLSLFSLTFKTRKWSENTYHNTLSQVHNKRRTLAFCPQQLLLGFGSKGGLVVGLIITSPLSDNYPPLVWIKWEQIRKIFWCFLDTLLHTETYIVHLTKCPCSFPNFDPIFFSPTIQDVSNWRSLRSILVFWNFQSAIGNACELV